MCCVLVVSSPSTPVNMGRCCRVASHLLCSRNCQVASHLLCLRNCQVARAAIAMLPIVAHYAIPKHWQTHRIHTHTAWSLCFNSSQVITLHDTKTLADAQNPPTKHTDRRVGLTPAYVLRGCVIPIDTRQYGTVLPCCLTPALGSLQTASDQAVDIGPDCPVASHTPLLCLCL